jgi:hypothetical protein
MYELRQRIAREMGLCRLFTELDKVHYFQELALTKLALPQWKKTKEGLMKKLFVIMGLLGLLFVLAGCNSNQSEQQQEDSSQFREPGSSGATKR